MEENKNIPVNPKINIPISKKLENFWYHYKWHTLISAFVLIVGFILISQLFTKTSYDINIIYAGEKAIQTTSLSGDGKTELSQITNSIETVARDYNSDGKVRFNLHNLLIMSEDEYNEAVKNMTGSMEKAALESEIQQNRDTLSDLIYSGYYLYFFSEHVFSLYDGDGNKQLFADISQYTKDGADYKYASQRGIYISSLPIYETTDLSLLPPDTIVCIRLPGVFDGAGGSSKYEAAEELLKSLLSYGK